MAVLPLLVALVVGTDTATAFATSAGPRCSISVGVTQSPYNSATTMFDSYGGSTSCDTTAASIYAQGWLENSNGNLVATAPYHLCSSCKSLGSHGSYGPVSNGSTWTVQYDTNISLSKAYWVSWDPAHCTVANADSLGHYRDLECFYAVTVAAGAQPTVTAQINVPMMALDD